jgi:putative glutamine amidotransferase
MTGKRPLIGVTPWYDYEKGISYIKRGYVEGLLETGGLAVVMPLTVDEKVLDEVIDRCDGFLLSGGTDLDAGCFGEPNLPFNGEISPYRDLLEIYTVKRAAELDKPVFGICRGIQVMNVALGGTIYQDIRSQLKDVQTLKHSQEAPKWYPTHSIMIEKGSILWRCFNTCSLGVNSFHHQAVKDVAPGFAVTSRAPDGIIESIEHTGLKFAVGVQWHPELMWQEDRSFLNLFRAFAEACT